MRSTALFYLAMAGAAAAQQGQQGSPAAWPCVAGRPVDPAYLEISESTGGQLFLMQKGEVAHASAVMSASFTHPATILRAVGQLSGARDFEFPVDPSVESLLVLASVQCRNAVTVSRPDGSELTAANAAQSIELQAGRILRVDAPESGKWKVTLSGAGLFVLSVLAKTTIGIGQVKFLDDAAAAGGGESPPRLSQPRRGGGQNVEVAVSGDPAKVKFELVDAGGAVVAELDPAQSADGVYKSPLTVGVERFRLVLRGVDESEWPVLRTHPMLFRAERPK